jgi:opacity protein-like surface antigen
MNVRLAWWVLASLVATQAAAQEPQVHSRAPRNYDLSIGLVHIGSEDTGFDGGTVVRTESDVGFSFAFDYYFRERWSVGVSTSTHTMDYTADIAVAGPLGQPGQRVIGELESTTLIGHTKRYFGNWDRVEPYAMAGLGFASVDTNIPDGPPVGVCWWHPWWGYVCDAVQPTRSSTEPAASLAFGVRVDFGRRLFFDANVTRQWIDFDTADRPGFSQLRVAIGFR